MTTQITVIGLNHKTAPVQIRERLAFSPEKLNAAFDTLTKLSGLTEFVILSTCNRVELYLVGSVVIEAVFDSLSSIHSLDKEVFKPHLYVYQDTEAVRHIFRVACSLDSMIVGEPQILGQLKDAFEYALKHKSSGTIMNKLMKKAISTAKRVRNETNIARSAVSISYAAVELAKKIFSTLTDKSFMLLGAGEMAELAAKHLLNSGVKNVKVANRTYERACELAKEFCGSAVRFEDFVSELSSVDILICSTGASHYVLDKHQMSKVMKARRHKPIFIIDISVPRNIDPLINELDNVYLYDVDDLADVVDANKTERQKEAQKAEAIVQEEVAKFEAWLSSLESVPVIVALRQKAEDIKNEELQKAKAKLAHLKDNDIKTIEYLATAIVNKLLHPPTTALKEASEDRLALTELVKKLYGINNS